MRTRLPGLFVPRTRPSQEQLVRARTVAEHPSYQMLHPDELSPERMREALGRLLELERPAAPPDEFEGADRAARVLSALADEPRARRHVPHRAARSQARDLG
jgi:predicted glycosyltransferase